MCGWELAMMYQRQWKRKLYPAIHTSDNLPAPRPASRLFQKRTASCFGRFNSLSHRPSIWVKHRGQLFVGLARLFTVELRRQRSELMSHTHTRSFMNLRRKVRLRVPRFGRLQVHLTASLFPPHKRSVLLAATLSPSSFRIKL